MKVTFYPQARKSRTDKRYYANSSPIHYNSKLILNEERICSQHHRVFLLVLVRTYYKHFQWRKILREQLTHSSSLRNRLGLIVKYVFLFGSSNDPSVMKLIKEESNTYHDIIQEDFFESYINLTRKVIMGYKWVINYCSNADYIMVGNDELSYDTDKIVSFLIKEYSMGRKDDHFAICYPIGNSKALHKGIPQFQKLDQKYVYQGNYYPPYCHGYGYVAHIYVINKLYQATFITPSFMPTDVWIGIMSEKLRLQIPNHSQLYILKDIENYYANSYYPVLPGAIAVADFEKYKGHELETLQKIMVSLRSHWKRDQYLQNVSPQAKKEHGINKSVFIYMIIISILIIIILKKRNVFCQCYYKLFGRSVK